MSDHKGPPHPYAAALAAMRLDSHKLKRGRFRGQEIHPDVRSLNLLSRGLEFVSRNAIAGVGQGDNRVARGRFDLTIGPLNFGTSIALRKRAVKAGLMSSNGEATMSDTDSSKPNSRGSLLAEADKFVEAFGEMFIEQRFTPNCACDDSEFQAGPIERFSRTGFPRVLIDPEKIDGKRLTIDRLKADLAYLSKLVEENPDGVLELVRHLDDPEECRAHAAAIGLTEGHFRAADGGLGWLLIIPVVLILTGCPGPAAPAPARCGAAHPTAGVLCTRPPHGPAGTTGGHVNPLGVGYRW